MSKGKRLKLSKIESDDENSYVSPPKILRKSKMFNILSESENENNVILSPRKKFSRKSKSSIRQRSESKTDSGDLMSPLTNFGRKSQTSMRLTSDSETDQTDLASPRSGYGRKSKDVCKKLLSVSAKNNAETSDFEESEYDSDVDPEFKYDVSDDLEEELGDSEDNSSDTDSAESDISNFTAFNETFDMLTNALNNETIPSKLCPTPSSDDQNGKVSSKRKISEECNGIYGLALRNLWEQKYDEAIDQCSSIIKEYPSFWGSYDILAQIYENRGDLKKANQLYYTSVMCNPKNSEKWIDCIERAKIHEGFDKAIELAKQAISRTNSRQIRELLAQLLDEGGYKKESMKRKLANLEAGPRENTQAAIEDAVQDLFALSETFESLKDFKRSSKCMEIINTKYPEFLSDEHRMRLLKMMTDVQRYSGVVGVVGKIQGVQVNLNEPRNLVVFSDDIDPSIRRQILFTTLFTTIHMEMTMFVNSDLFSTYLKQLIDTKEQYLTICNKLFLCKHFKIALEFLQYLINNTDDKLNALKLKGKCLEALSRDTEALETYDYIIDKINEHDASIWEMKANLLYRLKREEEAIRVLSESQRFISANPRPEGYQNDLSIRLKPTKDSLYLLCKLCQLLFTEERFSDFVQVAWKFLFIDSLEYFSANKINLSCDDLSMARANIPNIQNKIWLCISKTLDANGHCVFPSTHSKMGDSSTWEIWEKLMDQLSDSKDETDTYLIELLAQWGLVLQKILNWDIQYRFKISIIYVIAGIKNRMKNHRLRLDVSGKMIFQELRFLRNKYGETMQFWNLLQIYTHVMDINNIRFILRNMPLISKIYPLELINSGSVLTGSAKLSLAINGKLFFEHRSNAQVALHLAITLINSALSRTCRDTVKPTSLAIEFLSHYRQLRGECQETFYNMARFYQRIRNDNVAIALYNKCLSTPASGSTDYEKALNDLTKEAAFNLIHIYKSRNNFGTAHYLRQKYLVI